MSDLNLFFRENAEEKQVEVEVEASKRFKDKDGNIVPFRFRLLDSKEISAIQKSGVKITKTKKGMETSTDMDQIKMEAVVQSIIYPNLKDVNLQKSYDALTEKELITNMLEGRELERLGSKILREQGFVEDFTELITDAKN